MTASQLPLDQTLGPAPAPDAGVEEPSADRRRRRKALLLLLLLGFLAFLIGLTIWYLLFRQPINPIPPVPQSQVPAYTTSLYGATKPVGVAVTSSGDRVYVAESGAQGIVRMLDGSGKQIGTLVPPATTGPEHVPVYVAIDPVAGEVYVTDRITASIYIYDADGRYQRTFNPTGQPAGWQPVGIAFDKAGDLFVTSVAAPARVVKFDRKSKAVATFGASDALSFPNGVAVDDVGFVYVTDSNNGRLLVYSPDGQLVGKIGRGVSEGNLGLPRGVVIGPGDRVFVADVTGQSVFVYGAYAAGSKAPQFLGSFGTEGSTDGTFELPNGIAADSRGRLYVADTGNDRVQVWSY